MRILIVLAVVLALPVTCFAWTEALHWDADPSATSYKVEKSVDAGATWTVAGTPTTPSYTYTGVDTGTVLFRVSNCNLTGCSVRGWSGFWHNEAWRPAAFPANIVNP